MKWRKGPPPSIGWWPASSRRNADILRWWNGKRWGFPAHIGMTAEEAADQSVVKVPADIQAAVEWTDRPADWPERSKT